MTTHPATTVQSLISQHYDLPSPVSVKLFRAFTNDVYDVEAGTERYVLKIYGTAWRNRSELRFEVELLHHLHRKGVPVALPIPARDLDPVQTHRIGEAERHMMLFAWAPGQKPQPPFLPDLYEIEGRAVASFHAESDDFRSDHSRPALDLDYLVTEPVALISRHLANVTDKDFVTRFSDQLTRKITDLADAGLDWGPCHGDATLDNFHIDSAQRIIWYDVDSGGPGWRAGDLQGWAAIEPDAAPLWHAFLRGYQNVRPLAPSDIEAAPYISAAFELWGTSVDLSRRSIPRGEAAVAERLDAALGVLNRWATYFRFD